MRVNIKSEVIADDRFYSAGSRSRHLAGSRQKAVRSAGDGRLRYFQALRQYNIRAGLLALFVSVQR